ncbi:MAG: hypothetical protein ACI85K_002474, partial [Hyphomicrobiaceae bacterium]
ASTVRSNLLRVRIARFEFVDNQGVLLGCA